MLGLGWPWRGLLWSGQALGPGRLAVRGRGLFVAFDLSDPKKRDEFWKGLFDRGLLVLKSGDHSIRFRPALDITTEVVDEAMDLLRAQCQAMPNAIASQ